MSPAVPLNDTTQFTGTILTRTVNDIDSGILNKYDFDYDTGAYKVVVTNDTADVIVTPLNTGDPEDFRKLASQKLNILKDKEGKPIGFYGIVSTYTMESSHDFSAGKEQYGREDYIIAMNEREKKLPEISGTYSGTVYYDHSQAPEKKGELTLHYAHREITGTIVDPHGLNLQVDTRKPHHVDTDGSFLASLVGKLKPNDPDLQGYIDGAFYGKTGEIVAGHIRSKNDDEWGGVFGGQRKE
ncbi:transferrin-binding protein-like solute binding protein [Salmonella enterica]|nr:transferrin-binding protein-like solute binding protein [Salmonella enterica]